MFDTGNAAELRSRRPTPDLEVGTLTTRCPWTNLTDLRPLALRRPSLWAALLLVLLWPGFLSAQDSPLQEAISSLEFREIGPAIMGDRVADFAVDESNRATFYVGLATGGLWKTTSQGMTFTPVFDEQPNASIGAVTLAPSNPQVVWAGTGEPQKRQPTPYGDGMYKSKDGGKAWQTWDFGAHATSVAS